MSRAGDKAWGCFVWIMGLILLVAFTAMFYSAIDGIGFMRGWWK